MTPPTLKALDGRLQQFLEDLLEPMGRSERRQWARIYVHGLLLDGERVATVSNFSDRGHLIGLF